jgi:uncharacterized membrane protein YphA (DoxX/SURF4 family)
MEDFGRKDPRWVDAILDWRWTWLMSRALVVGLFLISGVWKLANFPAAMAEQEAVGLHPGAPWALLTIIVEIGAPLSIMFDRFVWLAAGALGVFTGLTALLAHRFWTLQGQARFDNMNDFLEHLSIIGGLVMTAVVAEHAKRDQRR